MRVLPLSKKLNENAEKGLSYAPKSILWWNMTTPVPLASDTAARTEIGTPFCLTYDFDSETDGCVTIRDRDTMAQERVAIDRLVEYIEARLEF